MLLVYYCTSHQVCMYVSLSQLRRGPISQISKRAAPRQLLWGRSSGRWWTTPGSNKIIENQSRTLASPLLTRIDLIDLLSNVMWKISWLFPAESNIAYCHTTIVCHLRLSPFEFHCPRSLTRWLVFFRWRYVRSWWCEWPVVQTCSSQTVPL